LSLKECPITQKHILIKSPKLNLRIAWINFQELDESISIGLTDRYFKVETVRTVGGTVLDLSTRPPTEALENPHITFHPRSIVSQIGKERTPTSQKIAAMLMPVDDFLEVQEEVAWAEFWTRPLNQITSTGKPRGNPGTIQFLAARQDQCVLLSFHFVRRIPRVFDWSTTCYEAHCGRILRVSMRQVIAQQPGFCLHFEG
jgi:hypothetical protein